MNGSIHPIYFQNTNLSGMSIMCFCVGRRAEMLRTEETGEKKGIFFFNTVFV